MRTRHRKVQPPVCNPKFRAGQRVRISPVGVEALIAPAGTTGIVEDCHWLVTVLIDGAKHSHAYAPDFWEEETLPAE